MIREDLEEKIRNLKDRIADIKDYTDSDFCIQCINAHEEILSLQEELNKLYDTKNQ